MCDNNQQIDDNTRLKLTAERERNRQNSRNYYIANKERIKEYQRRVYQLKRQQLAIIDKTTQN